MHRLLVLIGLGAVALAGGCISDGQQIKPPKHPEEFRAPPESDPRYSRPIEYPKDTMEQDALLKKSKDSSKTGLKPGMGGGPGGRGF